jgi:hypothetical protein
MKLREDFQSQPAGKGKIPTTEKQADQMVYYDSIQAAWRFPKPLSYSLIEKLNLALCGSPRCIPLAVWQEVIDKMGDTADIQNPFGLLRFLLMKRLEKPQP